MLKKLQKRIKIDGLTKVSYDLGYRSPGTILHWFKNNHIPNLAKEKVKNYLNQKEK